VNVSYAETKRRLEVSTIPPMMRSFNQSRRAEKAKRKLMRDDRSVGGGGPVVVSFDSPTIESNGASLTPVNAAKICWRVWDASLGCLETNLDLQPRYLTVHSVGSDSVSLLLKSSSQENIKSPFTLSLDVTAAPKPLIRRGILFGKYSSTFSSRRYRRK
jgi:hypothetical protein